jgi:hypothetical protein
VEDLNFALCSVPMLHSRNKSEEYQDRIVLKLTVLLEFLKSNELIFTEPFKADGSLDLDFILKRNDAKPECVELFKKVIPGWFSYLDKGGDINNIKRLSDGLKKIAK